MGKAGLRKRSTISDVAALAGLSAATVSRFINKSAPISPEKAARIAAAIRELHYLPHSAAQGLARNKTHTIGLLLPMISGQFFAPLLRGVEQAATEKGYPLLVHSTQIRPQGPFKKVLAENNTDGLLVFAASLDHAELSRLHAIGFPVVLLHQSSPAGLSLPYITVDNLHGARCLVDHLIKVHGCKRILHLRGPEDHEDAHWREMGYREALQANRIPFDPELIAPGGFNTEISRHTMRAIIQRGISFDAIFAGDDESASGAMMELRQAGFRIPEAVAVVGFDDLDLASHLNPPLTTVHSPIEQVAFQAVLQLISLIEKGQAETATILPTKLVIRKSCGCQFEGGD